MKFSANLGFLWPELTLVEGIHAAHKAGFDAVECHWPYDVPTADVRAALAATHFQMLGLNTVRGDVTGGENGLAALPGREREARAAIDQAITYAHDTGTRNVHVMAGFASGDKARDTFIANLGYAAEQGKAKGVDILIEPLNHYDAPGYFLNRTDQARDIIETLGEPNVRLMFDCYHVQIMEGDLSRRLADLLPIIGHVQFASVPQRAEPDIGEVAYGHIFAVLEDLGYDAPLGAEYKPRGSTDEGLTWLHHARA